MTLLTINVDVVNHVLWILSSHFLLIHPHVCVTSLYCPNLTQSLDATLKKVSFSQTHSGFVGSLSDEHHDSLYPKRWLVLVKTRIEVSSPEVPNLASLLSPIPFNSFFSSNEMTILKQSCLSVCLLIHIQSSPCLPGRVYFLCFFISHNKMLKLRKAKLHYLRSCSWRLSWVVNSSLSTTNHGPLNLSSLIITASLLTFAVFILGENIASKDSKAQSKRD